MTTSEVEAWQLNQLSQNLSSTRLTFFFFLSYSDSLKQESFGLCTESEFITSEKFDSAGGRTLHITFLRLKLLQDSTITPQQEAKNSVSNICSTILPIRQYMFSENIGQLNFEIRQNGV